MRIESQNHKIYVDKLMAQVNLQFPKFAAKPTQPIQSEVTICSQATMQTGGFWDHTQYQIDGLKKIT